MDIGAANIASLVEFYTVEEIRAAWKQAFESSSSRVATVIHISSRSREGSASAGISLATPAEYAAFIAACQQAIQILGGSTAVSPETLGTQVNFSLSPVGA